MQSQSITRQEHVHVVAGVIVRNQRVLLAQRSHPPNLAGYWEFPGGKCKASETPEQSLVRELNEELGIKVSVGSLLKTIELPCNEPPLTLQFFKCTILQGEPKPLGCNPIAWVHLGELNNYKLLSADRQFADWFVAQGET